MFIYVFSNDNVLPEVTDLTWGDVRCCFDGQETESRSALWPLCIPTSLLVHLLSTWAAQLESDSTSFHRSIFGPVTRGKMNVTWEACEPRWCYEVCDLPPVSDVSNTRRRARIDRLFYFLNVPCVSGRVRKSLKDEWILTLKNMNCLMERKLLPGVPAAVWICTRIGLRHITSLHIDTGGFHVAQWQT